MSEIYGMKAPKLDDGSMPIEAVAFVKYMNAQGKTCWSVRRTDGVDDYEVATLLRVEAQRIELEIIDGFETHEDGADD